MAGLCSQHVSSADSYFRRPFRNYFLLTHEFYFEIISSLNAHAVLRCDIIIRIHGWKLPFSYVVCKVAHSKTFILAESVQYSNRRYENHGAIREARQRSKKGGGGLSIQGNINKNKNQ